jgi:hypothetical protein
MSNESYNRYLKGLHFLEGGETPETRAEYALAERTLASLRGAVIGAGANTWRSTKDRYERARKRFREFPTPCQVTLYHVAEPCQNLGENGACEKCSKTVINVMHNTCARYGIALD